MVPGGPGWKKAVVLPDDAPPILRVLGDTGRHGGSFRQGQWSKWM